MFPRLVRRTSLEYVHVNMHRNKKRNNKHDVNWDTDLVIFTTFETTYLFLYLPSFYPGKSSFFLDGWKKKRKNRYLGLFPFPIPSP